MGLQLRSSAPISLSIFAALIMGTHTVDQQHTVHPEMNLYRPSNLTGNATYMCSIATPGGPTLTWEVGGQQIIVTQQVTEFTQRGIYIDPWPTNNTVTVTTLVVSEQARQTYKNLSVQCVARRNSLINIACIKVPREPYYIISYDPPSAIVMDELQLVPMDKDLILRWDRPSNVPIEVAVDYTIIINSTNDSTTVYNQYFTTNETSVSLQFLQALILNDNAGDDCITFELSVSGGNDAGSAQLTTIMDSIPLSIDIRTVSDTLKVERVNLDPLLIKISFLPVIPCNVKYPLGNYTIRVDNVLARVIDDNSIKPFKKDSRVHLDLNETTLPGVTLDGSFNLTVTACNNITCRESNNVTFNTTDIQAVEAVFYKNRLFLRCTFTDDSKAQGCALNLTLFGGNGTEIYKIYHKDGDTGCLDVNNQLEAYRDIVVFDIEEDGTSGNIGLPIELDEHVNVSTANNFTQMTGCRTESDGDSNVALTIGGVLGSVGLLIIVALACILIPIIVTVVRKRRDEIDLDLEVVETSPDSEQAPAGSATEETDGDSLQAPNEASPPKHPTSPPKEKQQDKREREEIELTKLQSESRTVADYASLEDTDTEMNVLQAEKSITEILKECGICLSSDIHEKKIISIDLWQLSQCFPETRATKRLKLKITKSRSAQTDA